MRGLRVSVLADGLDGPTDVHVGPLERLTVVEAGAEQFLGTSLHAQQTRLLNPEVLRFEFDMDAGRSEKLYTIDLAFERGADGRGTHVVTVEHAIGLADGDQVETRRVVNAFQWVPVDRHRPDGRAAWQKR